MCRIVRSVLKKLGYEHVNVIKPIGFPDVPMLKSIQEIKRGGEQGDRE